MEIYENLLFTREMDRFNINISSMARAVLEPGVNYSATNPAFTRIYYVVSGEGRIVCNGLDIPMQAGNIYILPTKTDFAYYIHTAMEKVYFHINLLRYDYYDLMQCVNGCIRLSNREKEIETVLSLVQKHEDLLSVLQMKTVLYTLLSETMQRIDVSLGNIEQYSPIVKKAINYVEGHMHFGMNSTELADKLFVSNSKLRQVFRKEVGVSVSRYVNDRLLFTAERQLRLTTRAVKDISCSLGFSDPFYFSRIFSSRYGMSPTMYRKSGGS